MGGKASLDHVTYIANDYSREIEARVTVNHVLLTSKKVDVKKERVSADLFENWDGTFGDLYKLKKALDEDETFRYVDQHPGFVRIMPGKKLAFNISGADGRVYVSVKSGAMAIADNFPVLNNGNIRVGSEGCAQHASDEEIGVKEC